MSDSWNWHSDSLYERNVWFDYQDPGVLVRVAGELSRLHSSLVSELSAARVMIPIQSTRLLHGSEAMARRVTDECLRQDQARREQSLLYQRLIADGLCP